MIKKGSDVEIIAASISDAGIPIITYQLRYWRGIHAEVMTHRVFSRNAGSSRARPSKGIIEQVTQEPWGPVEWGSNKPGMQAGELIEDTAAADSMWIDAAMRAGCSALNLQSLNLHKQVVNRVLEPFTYIDVVLTATDFANFFALRDHKDADPTIRELAVKMDEARDSIEYKYLKEGEWHLPYIDDATILNTIKWFEKTYFYTPDAEQVNEILLQISSARCARVSYKAFDGTTATVDQDIALYDRLVRIPPIHASPTEHQASPDCGVKHSHTWGNFTKWIQYRKLIPNNTIYDYFKKPNTSDTV